VNARGVESLAVVRNVLVRVLERPAQALALQGAQFIGARLLDRLGLIHCAHHFMKPGSQVASWGKATMIASSATSATLKGITPRNTVAYGQVAQQALHHEDVHPHRRADEADLHDDHDDDAEPDRVRSRAR